MDDKQFNELVDLLNRLIHAVDGVSTAIITRDPQTPKNSSLKKALIQYLKNDRENASTICVVQNMFDDWIAAVEKHLP